MATKPTRMSSEIPSISSSNSRPFVTQTVVFNSLHAQQIFERTFDMCANALFSLSVVLRFIGTEDQAKAVEHMVDDLLSQTLEELKQESSKLKELTESNGCEMGIGYTNAREIVVQITSPRSVRFTAIIREFDALIAKMDALWLAGVIDDTRYALEAYQWKRKILRLAGEIRTFATRAVIAARKSESKITLSKTDESTLLQGKD